RTATVGKFTGWSPADLGPAVALWLDADDAETITLSEGAVSEWRDKSGNGRHVAQADAARRPVPVGWGDGSREAIAFDGTDDFLQGVGSMTTGTYAGHFNVIWAASRVGGGGTILTERSSTLVGVSQWFTEFISSDGANYSSNHTISTGVFGALGAAGGVVSHMHFPGSRDVLYLNGAQQTVLTATASNITGGTAHFRIGSRENPHNQNWNGTILEIIVLLEFLGSDDRQRLEGYLAQKWGLAGSLPAGHPWKAGPP
ncbi:MAG: Cyanophage, partial [Pseudomonadota bacterium]